MSFGIILESNSYKTDIIHYETVIFFHQVMQAEPMVRNYDVIENSILKNKFQQKAAR